MVVMHETLDHLLTLNDALPTTFSQALEEKYINQEEIDNRLVLPGDRKISTAITLVGFGKVSSVQKQLIKLSSIDLSSKRIASIGSIDDLRTSLNHVQLLNLADNLLSWQEVNAISSCLPNLRELIITNNPLEFSSLITPQCTIKKKLASLTLGRNSLDWSSSIKILSQIWSVIDQIDFWKSNLTSDKMVLESIETLDCFVQNIRVLKLSHNSFIDIQWIAHVGPLVNLIELDLSNCNIQYIVLNETISKQLHNIQSLNISYNRLTDWRSISNLHTLGKLKNLICHENPLFTSIDYAKSLILGRLGRIENLNREEVTKSTRRDAEIFYLRKVFGEYQAYKKGDNQNFLIDHPRYEELVELYGVPDDLLEKKVFDKYLNIDLCYQDKSTIKKLPFDMRVSNLRMLCKRLFKMKPSANVQITCCAEPHDSSLNYKLDQDGQTLHFFSVKNGQKLLIEEST